MRLAREGDPATVIRRGYATIPARQVVASSLGRPLGVNVLGFQRLEGELTPDAIDLGLDVALPAHMQLDYQIGEFGRGERI